MDFPGKCHRSDKEIFKPLCSFLEQQKETFLSLVNHNLSLLSWCKPDLQSIDSGHGVTYYGNTSFIKVTEEVIQIRMVLDILTAAQGGTCAIIKVVYIFLIYLAIYQLL